MTKDHTDEPAFALMRQFGLTERQARITLKGLVRQSPDIHDYDDQVAGTLAAATLNPDLPAADRRDMKKAADIADKFSPEDDAWVFGYAAGYREALRHMRAPGGASGSAITDPFTADP